ncbi:hypothetical protein BG003_009725 [Podila horticola]|nr:hypothetical protein BG003_009725 [Podila horticola]
MLKQIDWDIIAELVKVLRIIENMTLIFSSDSKGFAASLYPWVANVLDEMTALKMPSNVLDRFRHDLKDELEERATVPDGLGDEEGSAIHRLLKRQRTVRGHAALQDDQELNEVERYFICTLTYKPVDPLERWRHNKSKFPVMAKIAQKYLAIPATSVASERMFTFARGVCMTLNSKKKLTPKEEFQQKYGDLQQIFGKGSEIDWEK